MKSFFLKSKSALKDVLDWTGLKKVHFILFFSWTLMITLFQNADYGYLPPRIQKIWTTATNMFNYFGSEAVPEALAIKNITLNIRPLSNSSTYATYSNTAYQGVITLNSKAFTPGSLNTPTGYLERLTTLGHEIAHHVAIQKNLDSIFIDSKKPGGFNDSRGFPTGYPYYFISEALIFPAEAQINADFASMLLQSGNLSLAREMTNLADDASYRAEAMIMGAHSTFDNYTPKLTTSSFAVPQVVGTRTSSIGGIDKIYKDVKMGQLKLTRLSSPAGVAMFSITDEVAVSPSIGFEIKIDPLQGDFDLSNTTTARAVVARAQSEVTKLKTKVLPETALVLKRVQQKIANVKAKTTQLSGAPLAAAAFNSKIPSQVVLASNFNFAFYQFNAADLYKDLPNSLLGRGPYVAPPITFLYVEVLGFGPFNLPEPLITKGF